jgi:hypothetical protein
LKNQHVSDCRAIQAYSYNCILLHHLTENPKNRQPVVKNPVSCRNSTKQLIRRIDRITKNRSAFIVEAIERLLATGA